MFFRHINVKSCLFACLLAICFSCKPSEKESGRHYLWVEEHGVVCILDTKNQFAIIYESADDWRTHDGWHFFKDAVVIPIGHKGNTVTVRYERDVLVRINDEGVAGRIPLDAIATGEMVERALNHKKRSYSRLEGIDDDAGFHGSNQGRQ
jgi:hypothetical protein